MLKWREIQNPCYPCSKWCNTTNPAQVINPMY
jgi:hypothetical protein